MSDYRTKLVNHAIQSVAQPRDARESTSRAGFEAGQTIGVGDRFNERIVQRNREIHELLRSNYHRIAPADLDLFQSMMLDLERMQVECESGYTALPLAAYAKAGVLLYTRDDFTSRVKDRLDEKRRRLDGLVEPWWRRIFRRRGARCAALRTDGATKVSAVTTAQRGALPPSDRTPEHRTGQSARDPA